MENTFFKLTTGDSPIIGASIHNGHEIRKELMDYMNLSEQERLREEDPYTAAFADLVESTIKVSRSRFEVDLNRSRDKAIYLRPEDAWGLRVWKQELPESIVSVSLAQYDTFYNAVKQMLEQIHDKFGYIIVLDIHSYNHKREGQNGPEADPDKNPDINIGTSNMNREMWEPVVEGFIEDLGRQDFAGRKLSVKENVKFKGGYFSNWIHKQFPDTSCSLAIEYKKIFMNEWTGELDKDKHKQLIQGLKNSIPQIVKNSKKIFEHA